MTDYTKYGEHQSHIAYVCKQGTIGRHNVTGMDSFRFCQEQRVVVRSDGGSMPAHMRTDAYCTADSSIAVQ